MMYWSILIQFCIWCFISTTVSAAPAVRRLPSAARTATPHISVRSSGFFWNSLPDYLRDPTRFVDIFRLDLEPLLFLFYYRIQRIVSFATLRCTNLLLTLTLTCLFCFVLFLCYAETIRAVDLVCRLDQICQQGQSRCQGQGQGQEWERK